MKIFYLKDLKSRKIYKKWEKKTFILNYHISYLRKNSNLNNIKENYQNFLCKLPNKASISKVKNRCRVTFRGRSNYKKFRLSRLIIKKLVFEGDFTGYKPLSW